MSFIFAIKNNSITFAGLLKKFGCYLEAEKTNHEWWYSPITEKRFPIPRHGNQEVPNGTLKNIEKQAGVKF